MSSQEDTVPSRLQLVGFHRDAATPCRGNRHPDKTPKPQAVSRGVDITDWDLDADKQRVVDLCTRDDVTDEGVTDGCSSSSTEPTDGRSGNTAQQCNIGVIIPQFADSYAAHQTPAYHRVNTVSTDCWQKTRLFN